MKDELKKKKGLFKSILSHIFSKDETGILNKELDELTKEDFDKIKKSKSKTFPVLIYWMILFLGITVVCSLKGIEAIDLQLLCWLTGAVCFSYMGLEYASAFMKNKKLPEGNHALPEIGKYRLIVDYWLIMNLVVVSLYAYTQLSSIPVTDCISIAGFLSTEYIVGNKANKIGGNMKPTEDKPCSEEKNPSS